MNFYKSVIEHHGKLLVRGIHNGQEFKEKIDYSPTLYAISQQDTEFKTLSGQSLKPIQFGSIKKAREFKRSYNTENAPIFGMDRYQYQYIADNYPEDIEFSKQVKQFADFNEFVINYLSFQQPPPCQVVDTYDTNMKTTCHFLPQSSWVCDFWYKPFEDIKIYRYENLEKLEKELEIQMPFHYNKSNKPNYLDVYNEQSKDIIYSMYKYDFVNFGYEK